jgi:hypothetical protein
MLQKSIWLSTVGLGLMLTAPAAGDIIYNNLTPNNQMGIATRPDSTTGFEIEAGDDFLLNGETLITNASFTGLFVSPTGGPVTVADLVIEIYRVFPKDSGTVRTPAVPTRMNSPSDVAFESRDSAGGELTFTTALQAPTFTALKSIQPGGIALNTGGNGEITGQEVQLNVTFSVPFDLPADHYFFVPQVLLSGGGQFFWLSASRPISGSGTTPFAPDLQAWTRDEALDPDWLRVGTDIVGGGASAPQFNAAFSLSGSAVPEPTSVVLLISMLVMVGLLWHRAGRQAKAKK